MAASGRGHDADVVVVGAGIAGAAAARALARAGRSVVALEQFDLGHERGSSHGGSRIFRLAYPDPRYVDLARRSLEGWRELEAECGEPLLVQTGSLDLGAVADEHARALETCGLRFERLRGREVGDRWPIAAGRDETAIFQPDGGFALADRAYAAFVGGARAAGADLRERAAVTAIEPQEDGVVLTLDEGPLVARAVVVTAGAWAARLLQPLGIELDVSPTRETVTYFRLHDADVLPSVIDSAVPSDRGVVRDGRVSYALAAPGLGLKAGLHRGGTETDPDEPGAADDGIVAWAAEWVAGRYPEADASPLAAETCIYTNRPDESFVLERHGRIVVGSACSGHGFKFAPLVGTTLAGLVSEIS
jgi:sarcosine oxidase